MPPPLLIVDGVELADYGLWGLEPDGARSAPTRRDITEQVIGVPGGIPMPCAHTLESRVLTLKAVLMGDPAAVDKDAAALGQWDSLKALLARGSVTLRLPSTPTRQAVGTYTEAQFVARGGGAKHGAQITIGFALADPYLYATTADSYALAGGAETAITVGTAPSRPKIRILGPVTNPLLTLRDGAGLIVGTAQFTVALVTGDWLEMGGIDADVILHRASGAESLGLLALTGGDIITVRPLDVVGASQPKLQLTAASGAQGTATVTHYRTYL